VRESAVASTSPATIVKTLVGMLEPEEGVVFDPCCGSGGMFVRSDLFTNHSHQLSFVGQGSLVAAVPAFRGSEDFGEKMASPTG
jgi:hypothetical protein